MKILMITESLTRGGKERRLVELLRAFRENKEFQFQLILLKDDIKYPEVYDFENVETILLKRKINKDLRIFIQLFKLCTKFKPDLIHSWGSMPSVYIFPIAFILRIPLINAMIADAICKRYKTAWKRAKITFPFSNIILANSYAGIRAYYVPRKKARVIHNGFNADRIKSEIDIERAREIFKIDTKYVVSMIGAFHPRKDWNTFLEAAVMVLKQKNDICFLAAGDGELLEFYRNKYKEYHKIIFPGRVSDIESLLTISDIGVLTSNPDIHAEGISNSILETMAFGKPVIATDNGGTPEIIKSNENGFLVPAFNVVAVVEKIMLILESEIVRKRIGDLARKTIVEKFSIERMKNEYLQLYNELIKQ